jgi:hypothetical protein
VDAQADSLSDSLWQLIYMIWCTSGNSKTA